MKQRWNFRTSATLATLALALLAGCAQTTPSVAENPLPSPPAAAASADNSQMQAVQPPAGDQTTGQFEVPPIVNASDLLPAAALSGPGFYVQQQVPTNGAMGEYTIVADASVFHGDAGSYHVESLGLLKIRLAEIPAIAQLENVRKSEVFAKALASSAARPVEDAAQMVTHPMDTVTGLPGGIGEFFGRVKMGGEAVYSTATNSSESGGQRASQTAGETANITLTALGYDQVRRDLARKLHIDPYTTDPILTKKLNSVAWVMFSARLAVNTTISVMVPGSMLITGVEVTDDLVYQTPRADLILLVEKKLKKLGLSDSEIAAFSHNPAIPLSLQVAAVRDLESLGPIPGRHSTAVALSNLITEYQVRFLVTSIRMLAEWGQQKSPITGIRMQGVLVGTDQNGTVIMPAPVDYVSWTPRIAGFATDHNLLALQNRVLWLPAGMTPLARQQFTANGWTVHQSAQP